LSFLWHPPQKTKQNGVIISYTACVSRSQNGPCFQKFVTSEREWLVGNLNTSTKYYVRVLASTKVGHGPYSTSEGYFTNGRKFDMHACLYRDFVCGSEENSVSKFIFSIWFILCMLCHFYSHPQLSLIHINPYQVVFRFLLENTCMQKLALLTKPFYFPNMKYLK
jgi:hypothetical protein